MYYPVDSREPKGFRNLSIGKQASNHVHGHVIFPPYHSILLRSVSCGKLTMDSIGCIKLKELIWCEFPISISPQTPDASANFFSKPLFWKVETV